MGEVRTDWSEEPGVWAFCSESQKHCRSWGRHRLLLAAPCGGWMDRVKKRRRQVGTGGNRCAWNTQVSVDMEEGVYL